MPSGGSEEETILGLSPSCCWWLAVLGPRFVVTPLRSIPASSHHLLTSLIRTLSLDLGFTLIQHDLISILNLVISIKTLFANKVAF